MIMIVHHLVIILGFVVVSFSTGVFSASSSSTPAPSTQEIYVASCDRSCPSGNRASNRVPYPFGFSPVCEIQLNCSQSGEIQIGQFQVQKVTEDSILIDFPVNCSRRIEDLVQLFGKNFKMTWRNGLLMQNCSSPLDGCAIPTRVLNSRLNTDGCNFSSDGDNISCHSEAFSNITFLELDKIRNTNCSLVFSSVAVDLNNEDNDNSVSSTAVSLEFQTVELGWWLEWCNCDNNAKYFNFSLGKGGTGCRCRCNEGYAGDGFRDGDGCRRVHACNALKYISGQCGGTARVVLVGGVIAGASLMTVLALLCYCIRKRSTLLKNQTSAKRLLSEAAGSSIIPFYPYKEIERATNSFSDEQRLGTGAYGTVYAGKLHNDEWVAIKKMKQRDSESIDQVMNEVKLLSSVSHPNLVRLLGCCIENGEQILVYEFMPNGTLSQHLQRERGSGLPWMIRLTIATETAHAIAHLHTSMNTPIYHRDIKSSNILLDYNFMSKVADFGLSRFVMTDDSHISTTPQGTPGYVDPQYHQNFHLSDKSDVYSFGVVLVEIITALKVVDFSRAHSEINLAAIAIERIGKGRLDEIIDPFLDPNRDAWTLSSIHKVAELAFRCLAFHRDMRPSMMEVADELEQIRLSGWAPMEENICMGSSVASSCSSPFDGSEKSFTSRRTKKTVLGSRRLIVSQRGVDCLSTMQESRESSPVSVQDPWLSEQSSPSTSSLLSNIVH